MVEAGTTPVGYADSPLPAEAEPEHKKSGAGVAQPTPLPRSRKIGRKELAQAHTPRSQLLEHVEVGMPIDVTGVSDIERLAEIFDQIVGVLDANGETHQFPVPTATPMEASGTARQMT